MTDLTAVVARFGINVKVRNITPLGNGLINDTFIVRTDSADEPDYVLQRINNAIFRDVEALQKNIESVTRHIRAKLQQSGTPDIERRVLRFIQADNGKTYVVSEGEYWRLMVYIPDSVTKETVDEESSFITGKAFGKFQSMLADIPDTLSEIIPDFHNMEFRLKQFKEAIEEDSAGRVAEVRNIIDELLSRQDSMTSAERLYRAGKLPKRICHCDTKVNNILFDRNGEILCVIDLDTVMPSFVFSDFGDFLRTAANTAAEDERDISKIKFDMNIFKAFAKGYVSAADFLTQLEKDMLPYAALLFPYMQAVRFLTDYLNGDIYYKTEYTDHNLVRTKAQFALLQSAEACKRDMEAYISTL